MKRYIFITLVAILFVTVLALERLDEMMKTLNRLADKIGTLDQEPFYHIPAPSYELCVFSNMVSIVDGTNVIWSETEGGAK